MNLPVLVYDGHCRFCRQQASRLAVGSGGRIRLESFHDPAVLELHGITREAAEEAVHLVMPDGKIFSGASAVARAIRLNPIFSWLSYFYEIPGIKQTADAAYRWVARNRYRLGGRCSDGACRHA